MKSASWCLFLVLVIFSMSACSKNRVDMDAYNRINIGMGSEAITKILGKGTELSRSELAGHTTVIYQWTRSDGGNIDEISIWFLLHPNVSFKDDRKKL